MKAYVDLEKVLPFSLYSLIIDMRHYPDSTAKMRAERLDRSVQILCTQFQKLLAMGLATKIKYGVYVNTLDSKIND